MPSSSAASRQTAWPTASRTASSTLLITADEGRRGGRKVALKTNADEALKQCPTIKHVLVVKVTGGDVPMQDGRDPHEDAAAAASPDCPPEPMGAEDPLFILYTSGSTGKPKGVAAHHRRLHGLGQLHA